MVGISPMANLILPGQTRTTNLLCGLFRSDMNGDVVAQTRLLYFQFAGWNFSTQNVISYYHFSLANVIGRRHRIEHSRDEKLMMVLKSVLQ
jgi:hypothetical protein